MKEKLKSYLIYLLWKSGIMDFILSNYNFKNDKHELQKEI